MRPTRLRTGVLPLASALLVTAWVFPVLWGLLTSFRPSATCWPIPRC